MSDHIETIKTIEEFIAWVKELSGGSILYRGLADNDWPVEASASRRIKGHSNKNPAPMLVFQNYISRILEEARQRGLAHRTDGELYDLELLADLQHYGAATCLIDFTQSPFTALWFACKDEPEKDGKVIGMSTDDTNLFKIVDSKQQKKEITSFFKEESLWKWPPRDINNRIITQQSVFVFGKPQIEKEHYESVIIDKSNKASIIEILEKGHNISEVNLFRDMSGFAIANAHDKPYTEYKAEDYFSLGVDSHQRQEFERAIKHYSTVIELRPNDNYAYINRGITKRYLGDHKGAIEDFNKAIELNPNYAKAYNNRGDSRKAIGDHKGAIEDFDKVIELDPNYTKVYNNRGNSRKILGNHEDAIKDFDKAIKLNPNYVGAYYNRGITKRYLGDHEGAIEDFNKAIELKPNYADAYYNRGIAKGKIGDHKGAIEDFNKAIKLNPDFSLAYNNRGNARNELGDHKGAIKDYDKAIELNPSDTDTYYNRGLAKGDLSDYEGAIEDYDKAIELNPSDTDHIL